MSAKSVISPMQEGGGIKGGVSSFAAQDAAFRNSAPHDAHAAAAAPPPGLAIGLGEALGRAWAKVRGGSSRGDEADGQDGQRRGHREVSSIKLHRAYVPLSPSPRHPVPSPRRPATTPPHRHR